MVATLDNIERIQCPLCEAMVSVQVTGVGAPCFVSSVAQANCPELRRLNAEGGHTLAEFVLCPPLRMVVEKLGV